MAQETPAPSRRDTRRRETLAEIKSLARAQLAEGGVGALSLRGVTREMGMAPAAVYRYFASQAELVSALCVDAYNELGDITQAASDAHAADHADIRFWAICQAFRRWALANRNEFALLFGTPVPGFRAEAEATGPAAARMMVIIYTAYAAALSDGLADADNCFAPAKTTPGELGAHFLFDHDGGRHLRHIAIVLNGFASVLGFLSGEVFGSVSRLIANVDDLYAAHLRTAMVGMGFPRERVALLPDRT